MTSEAPVFGDVQRVAEHLRTAKKVAVLTGAGISAESGIPTFRDAQTGLWARFRPEELASPDAFARDPVTVWEWYRWRRELVDGAQPNAAHHAISAMQQRTATTVITQNVDGLHTAAGTRDVIELHGSIRRVRCATCGASRPWSRAEAVFPPLCDCHDMMRPDIVWFGEMLPQPALSDAFIAAESCDVFFSVGTSHLVQPAASLPWIAAKRGAFVAVVNVDTNDQVRSPNVVHLTGKAGDILPRVVQLAFEHSGASQ